MTPEAQRIMVARIRRMASELQKPLEGLLGQEVAEEMFKIQGRAIQDWHTLGQLYSPDKEQLKTGLQTTKALPIPEVAEHLRRLKKRYYQDSEVLPLVNEALKAVEKGGG